MEELPQERLGIAVGAQAAAQRAFDEAVKFTKDRKAFGKTVFEFQNTKFTLADLKAKLQVGWAHLDWAIRKHLAGELTTDEASAAKLWHTDLQWEACDTVAAAPWRSGLHERIRYRPPVARRARDADFRRDERDHEGSDLAEYLTLRLPSLWGGVGGGGTASAGVAHPTPTPSLKGRGFMRSNQR